MANRFTYLAEVKLSAVESYLSGEKSENQLARELNVTLSTIQGWVLLYKTLGSSAFTITSENNGYSEELKVKAVLDYLSGDYSQAEICRKFAIRSRTQLHNWALKYNSHERIKSSETGGEVRMATGRNTTFEERVEIIRYCIEHNRNYRETSEKFQVTYQQVWAWTDKFDKSGVDALVDRRGKRKPEDELTELERLKAQNKLLEAKNKRLEMENELLKKLEELERG